MRNANPHRANRFTTTLRGPRFEGAVFSTTDYAVIMAGDVIASIPVLIIFVIAQRYVIEGIARSVIEGIARSGIKG